ncbi:MAG: VWA domain-containing protein [Sulfurovum sp.]|nr:VWA domain-containing protein [Sulfurovum sp.]MCB4744445.1 VWA domain-containing protein [Sulfurovum sp.]MCB4745905.1 VWA domain-containing protein [Sulfurovum sp.]MCB4747599.1 VWA domain-containing protein [Sulfurovum sp.]MCB4748972.1 VWA domain-containing protein [Sulfurovum sp.]
MSQFSFEYPLIFLVILLFVVCARWCKERSRAIFFPHVATLIVGEKHKSTLLLWLKWVGIVLAITALASPVITKSYTNSKKEGHDIVLVIDSSDSMRQIGFDRNKPLNNKFDVVKEVVEDFIEKRENDRIGIVTFADVAFIASPLTFEKKFLTDITRMQKLGVAGKRTAINDALVQAYNLLNKSKAKSKIIILLTDGIDNMSKVPFLDVKSMIEKQKVKLYTIGIGGLHDYDAQYLEALAKAGHAEAFGARDAHMLEQIYAEIDKMEASKLNNKKVIEHTYLYVYPLFLAVLSLLLFLYFRNQKGV